MNITIQQLEAWMKSPENEHLEFKEAKKSFSFDEIVRYSVALANEKGGRIVLGVTNKHPRNVVGTQAFRNTDRVKYDLMARLHFRVDVHALQHPDGRVLVFEVPSRPTGVPIHIEGAYLMRSGESLVPMTQDQLRRIFDESAGDFSSEECHAATLSDLSPVAIRRLRESWIRKSGNSTIQYMSDEQVLADLELVVEHRVTFAALILLGNPEAVRKYLPQAEIIFEYRSDESSLETHQRSEFKAGFFLVYDDLWNLINVRNDLHHYQDGLFVWDIPTFNEFTVREAILNAISHRDYRRMESIFIRQFPRKLEIVSPGGFPSGITLENMLWRQSPRNRRIAEVLTKCGLVERSGQGVNRMFEESIKEAKLPPDFSGTDDYQVMVSLHGEVQDVHFLRFLERVAKETRTRFSTHDLIALDLIHREQSLPDDLRNIVPRLRDAGVVEVHGRGRGTRYLLSRRFYDFVGEQGSYTRKRGLDRETNKALILKHIERNRARGTQFNELQQVLPSQSRKAIQHLLTELKKDERIQVVGRTRAARWFPTDD